MIRIGRIGHQAISWVLRRSGEGRPHRHARRHVPGRASVVRLRWYGDLLVIGTSPWTTIQCLKLLGAVRADSYVDLIKPLSMKCNAHQIYCVPSRKPSTSTAAQAAFPTNIRIWRPQEEYSLKLEVTKLTINGPIMDDQFVLEPPVLA